MNELWSFTFKYLIYFPHSNEQQIRTFLKNVLSPLPFHSPQLPTNISYNCPICDIFIIKNITHLTFTTIHPHWIHPTIFWDPKYVRKSEIKNGISEYFSKPTQKIHKNKSNSFHCFTSRLAPVHFSMDRCHVPRLETLRWLAVDIFFVERRTFFSFSRNHSRRPCWVRETRI